jgi:hypothetical protein
VSEDGANFRRRLLDGEWFGEQMHAAIQHSIVDPRLARSAVMLGADAATWKQ